MWMTMEWDVLLSVKGRKKLEILRHDQKKIRFFPFQDSFRKPFTVKICGNPIDIFHENSGMGSFKR